MAQLAAYHARKAHSRPTPLAEQHAGLARVAMKMNLNFGHALQRQMWYARNAVHVLLALAEQRNLVKEQEAVFVRSAVDLWS